MRIPRGQRLMANINLTKRSTSVFDVVEKKNMQNDDLRLRTILSIFIHCRIPKRYIGVSRILCETGVNKRDKIIIKKNGSQTDFRVLPLPAFLRPKSASPLSEYRKRHCCLTC